VPAPALGVSSLILASRIDYDAMRIAGAGVLVITGLRSLVHRGPPADTGTVLGAVVTSTYL
jgi:threonine/homoserine/homoserine lactone efflux protein